MNSKVRKCLVIDAATSTAEVKSFDNLQKYIGGFTMGLKLYEMYQNKDPIVIAIGPLNGFFPFASKTCFILKHNGQIEDVYVGGNLSSRMRFAGLDAIILINSSETPKIYDIENSEFSVKDIDVDLESLGLPGKRCVLKVENDHFLVNDYFTAPDGLLEKKFTEKNIKAIVITGSELQDLGDFDKYETLYSKILARQNDLRVDQGRYPSCANCPRGCGKSRVGEIGGDIIVHSLVGCQYADKIYTDIGIVFACLNSLGFDYTHEDIELLPKLVEETLRGLA